MFDIEKSHLCCGDNIIWLDKLKADYTNKVKLIYIDPPYNTKNNHYIYNDSRDSEDWLEFMKIRLELAKELLSEDGCIFISIDDAEQAYLKVLCDSIFGRKNFVNTIIWERKYSRQNNVKLFSTNHEFILCYAKNKGSFSINLLPRTEQQDKAYKNPDNDPRGIWKSVDLSAPTSAPKHIYPVISPTGKENLPPKGRCWSVSKEKIHELLQDNRIDFASGGTGVPRLKCFLSEAQDGIVPMTIWQYDEVGHTDKATKELKAIFDGEKFFDYPKPIDLIKRMVYLTTKDDDIILDFFAGSGTTAQAVYEQNTEDSGNRKYLLVQLDESIKEGTDAYNHGYRTIFDVCKERVLRTTKTEFIEHRV